MVQKRNSLLGFPSSHLNLNWSSFLITQHNTETIKAPYIPFTSLYFVIGNPNFASSWFKYLVMRLAKSLNRLSTAVAHWVMPSLWKHDCLYNSSASWSKHLTFSLISYNTQQWRLENTLKRKTRLEISTMQKRAMPKAAYVIDISLNF